MNQSQTAMMPNGIIFKRLKRNNSKPKIGALVLVTRLDGSQFVGEIHELHERIKNWIIKVKRIDDDGIVTIEEVADLVIDAVIIVKDIALSDIWKTIGHWLKNTFRKRA
jgi:hypothetical protein